MHDTTKTTTFHLSSQSPVEVSCHNTPQGGRSSLRTFFSSYLYFSGFISSNFLSTEPFLRVGVQSHRFLILNMASSQTEKASTKPIVLHIGDPVKWNTELYSQFSRDFTVIRPSLEERQRDAFMRALKEKRWGSFSAIFRPFWNTGGEMGRWDREMIPLIPNSCKIFASAGAGFDWADVDLLAAKGWHAPLLSCEQR